ncbi:hypothetical protein CKO27_02525 [Thiocystis violacea]|nr:hypothetical protein [Thiocystis violacea]
MMVLKQSNEFSGYLAPNTDSTFGTWRTTLNLGGDLSHMTIYGRTAVPLPAAAWLFGSALLGIVGIGYRRKPGLS